MGADAAAERFLELFHRTYLRFHTRAASGARMLTGESLAVLLHLSSTGPLTIAEACEHFDRSQAAMSDIVTRLERRGLLARVKDDRDRRRTLVWLTEEGTAQLDRATRVLDTALVAGALSAMPEDRRRALLDGLEALLGTPHGVESDD
ncbi:MAG: MarR family winged helix-turn-helix transcriptional regulator [Planctomycetota bacterium]